MKAILILFLLPLKLFAQDITGMWTGTLYNDTTQKYVPYEIAISEDKGRLSGYSHTYWKPDNIDNVVNIGVKAIKIKRKKDKLYVEDEKWLYNNYPEPPPKGVRLFSLLSIGTGDSGMILSGPFNTNSTKEYASATGTIRLQKKNNYAQSKLIPKLEELNLSNTLSFIPPKLNDKDVLAVVNPPVEKPKVLQQSTENERVTTAGTTIKTNVAVPKITDKEVAKISSGESTDPDLPKSKEIVPDTAASIKNKPSVTIPKEKEAVVSTQKTATKLPATTTPTQKEVVTVAPPKPVTKAPTLTQPKQKEEVVVSVPKPLTKTPIYTVKQKAEVKVPPPEIKTPVIPPKQNEVVSAPAVKPAARSISNIVQVSAADLATRTTENIRSVNVKSDSLVLNLYDNGEVDGDTVSVVMNGKTIMSRQGLTANAITKTVYLTPDLGDSIQLIMYAENLGSIPPNTGLLILQDGNDRYEIRFAGDMKKNSAIILRRRH
jgi:hypothetical protein